MAINSLHSTKAGRKTPSKTENLGNVSETMPINVAQALSPHSAISHNSSKTALTTTHEHRRATDNALNYVMQPAMCLYTQPPNANDNVTAYAVDGAAATSADDLPLGADATSMPRNDGIHNMRPPTITLIPSNVNHNQDPLVESESGTFFAGGGTPARHRMLSVRASAAASKYMAKEGWRYILPASINNAIAFEQHHDENAVFPCHGGAYSPGAVSPGGISHHDQTLHMRKARSTIAEYIHDAPDAVPPRDVSQMMKTVLAAARVSPLPTLRLWRENLVVIASFLAMIMIEPIATSSGVFLTPLVIDLGVTYGEVSFALGLQSGGVYLLAPLTNYFNERFGFQLCAVISSFISMLAFAGTAYWAQTIWHFYIGYGFVGGVSLGVTLMSIFGGLGFVLPGKNGKMTFVITGIAVGNMVMPPLLDAIINRWKMPNVAGWRAGLYIISLLQVSLLVLCLIFRVPGERCCRGPRALLHHDEIKSSTLPTDRKKKSRCTPRIFPRVILNKRWLFLGISYFFWNFHRLFQIFSPHIVAIYYGGRYNTGVVITVFGVSELVGRVMTILLNSRPDVPARWRYTLMSACLLFCSACLGGAALLLEFDPSQVPFEVWCIPIAGAGFAAGIIWNTYPWYLVGEFGPFHFAQVSDWIEVFAGLAALISVVVAGQVTQLGMGGSDGAGEPRWVFLVAPFYMASAGVCGSWLSFMIFTVMSKRHVRKLALAKGGCEVIVVKTDANDKHTVATKPHVTIVENKKSRKNILKSILSSRKMSPNKSEEKLQTRATPSPVESTSAPVVKKKSKSSIFSKLSLGTNDTRNVLSNKSSLAEPPPANQPKQTNKQKSKFFGGAAVKEEINTNETIGEQQNQPPVSTSSSRRSKSGGRSPLQFAAPSESGPAARPTSSAHGINNQQLPSAQYEPNPVAVTIVQPTRASRASKSAAVERRAVTTVGEERLQQPPVTVAPVVVSRPVYAETIVNVVQPAVVQRGLSTDTNKKLNQEPRAAVNLTPAYAPPVQVQPVVRMYKPPPPLQPVAQHRTVDNTRMPLVPVKAKQQEPANQSRLQGKRSQLANNRTVLPYSHTKRQRKRWSPVKGTRVQRQQMYGKQVESYNRAWARRRQMEQEAEHLNEEQIADDDVTRADGHNDNTTPAPADAVQRDPSPHRPTSKLKQKDSVERIENAVEQWDAERRVNPTRSLQRRQPPPPPPSRR